MSLVLDSSVTLAWIYTDEVTEPVRKVFRAVSETGAWVPALWKLEIANVLLMGTRRGRNDEAFCQATLSDLSVLPIRTDRETDKNAWGSVLHLAAKHRLTTYDAAYLELALRRRLPLATLDHDLRRAAIAEAVSVVGS